MKSKISPALYRNFPIRASFYIRITTFQKSCKIRQKGQDRSSKPFVSGLTTKAGGVCLLSAKDTAARELLLFKGFIKIGRVDYRCGIDKEYVHIRKVTDHRTHLIR